MKINHRNRSRFVIGVAVLWALAAALVAGEMDPWAPPAPTMKPLDVLESRIPLYPEMFPLTITGPGSYYLTGHVTAPGGLTIAANDVTIDLNGFTLEGLGSGTGIQVSTFMENVTVRNGVVRGWGGAGVQLENHAVVEGVRAAQNGGAGIITGSWSLVSDCEASNNGSRGISVESHSVVRNSMARYNGTFDGEAGIYAGMASVVESCTAYSNGGDGIEAALAAVVVHSTATNNSGAGIRGGHTTKIDGGVAHNNHDLGIAVGDNGVVTDSVAYFSGSVGIWSGKAAIVRGSTTGENVGAGIETGPGSLVEVCTSRGNESHGILVGHGSTIRSCTSRENKLHGIYATYGVDVLENNCSRNGSASGLGGTGAGVYVEGVDNRVDGNLVLSNDWGIDTAIGQNVIVRNSASGNGDNYGGIAGGNDVGPIGTAATATSPWANVQF